MNETNDKPANASTSAPENATPINPPKYDWADPKIPAGNAPAMPRWPLVASGIAFTLWLLFLVAMAVVRTRTVSY